MGSPVETLADLLPRNPIAICVGVNPAPKSVAAGHYYQGPLGQRFFGRLRDVGLLPESINGWEDEAAYARGVGFTDLVKRPTTRAKDVRREELEHGRGLLIAKLAEVEAALVIFTFKSAAVALFGRFEGSGFLPGLKLGSSDAYVMPGPMEARDAVNHQLKELRWRLDP